MSYIQTLKTLEQSELQMEIKKLILEFSRLLINDKARRAIVSGDLEGSWDEVDEVEVDEVSIDSEKLECRVKFRWQSDHPRDEDDERVLYGWATAVINDNRKVSFVDTHAELEGLPPKRPRGGSAADAWWDSLDDDDRRGLEDNMNKE